MLFRAEWWVMKTEVDFSARYESQWRWLEDFLQGKQRDSAGEFPMRYRHLCAQLAQARGQGFSPALLARLNDLAVRGSARLYYRQRGDTVYALTDFLLYALPQAVRREWRWLAASVGIFLLAALGAALAQLWQPAVADNLGLAWSLSEMYEPSEHLYRGRLREGEDDVLMWGYYISHNTSISLRALAGGALAGVSTVYVDVSNGVLIGVAMAYGWQEGWLSETFLPFIVAHSSFELMALFFAAATGFALAKAVCFPRRLRRRDAVALVVRRFYPLLVAVIAFDFIAAAIEAFWSPRLLPLPVKYAVGLALWMALLSYFALVGRGAGSSKQRGGADAGA